MIRAGIAAVALTLAFATIAACVIDIHLESNNAARIGPRLRRWSQQYPVLAMLLAALLGAALAHFFINK